MKKFIFWRKLTGDSIEDNFSEKPEYHAFFQKAQEYFDLRIATNTDAYIGGGVFTNVYKYSDWKFVPAEKTFKADVVYQRKTLTDDTFDNQVPIFNTPEFKKGLSNNKWLQYQLLSEFMSKSFLLKSKDDFDKYVSEISTSKMVLKPVKGQKGENILILGKEEKPAFDLEILNSSGYLLQEYSDTNIEVPGIVSGLHDIKLITIGDHVFANLRVPENGKEFCTFDSPYTEISNDLLPESIIEFHKQIRERISSKYPNEVYTVDIGVTKDGPVLFEINGHTAFPYVHFNYFDDFCRAYFELLNKISS